MLRGSRGDAAGAQLGSSFVECKALIDMFGSVADALKSAIHDEHHRIYSAYRLTCEYDTKKRAVRASIMTRRKVRGGFERVRGGT